MVKCYAPLVLQICNWLRELEKRIQALEMYTCILQNFAHILDSKSDKYVDITYNGSRYRTLGPHKTASDTIFGTHTRWKKFSDLMNAIDSTLDIEKDIAATLKDISYGDSPSRKPPTTFCY